MGVKFIFYLYATNIKYIMMANNIYALQFHFIVPLEFLLLR